MQTVQGCNPKFTGYLLVGLAVAALTGASPAYADFTRTYSAHHPIGPSPVGQGWTPRNFSSAQEGLFANDTLADDGKAWQVSNLNVPGANPRYVFGFNLEDPFQNTTYNEAVQFGWRLSAKARFIENVASEPSMGITAYFENRVFSVAVDLDSAGNLRGHIPQGDVTGLTYDVIQLASGSAAEAYFEYALTYDPNSNTALLSVDGQVVREGIEGFELEHPPLFQFGSGLIAGGSGRMNYSNADVTLYSSPGPSLATQMGDFDGDGLVGLDDYALWRDNLGSSLDLTADADGSRRVNADDYQIWSQNYGQSVGGSLSDSNSAQQVPEPGSVVIVALVLAGGCMHCVRQRYRKSRPARFRRSALSLHV